jgi:hypothetical protein
VHIVAASDGAENVFCGQIWQAEELLLDEKSPAEQLVHDAVDEGAENVPAGHVKQAVAKFSELVYVPPGHCVQD